MTKPLTPQPAAPRHATAWITFLCALTASMTTSMAACAQGGPAATREGDLTHTEPVASVTDTRPLDATTARSWLQAQAGGTMATPNKQTLNGPAMSRIYQRLLKQLSGKGGGSGDAGAAPDSDAEAKDNPASDLLKSLSGAKP
jgi:hypothetical protein